MLLPLVASNLRGSPAFRKISTPIFIECHPRGALRPFLVRFWNSLHGHPQTRYQPVPRSFCSSGSGDGQGSKGDNSVPPHEGEVETDAESSPGEPISEEKAAASTEGGEGTGGGNGGSKPKRSFIQNWFKKEVKEEVASDSKKEAKENAAQPVVVAESQASKPDAIVPAGIRLENIRQVLVVPLRGKPLFPGLYRHVVISDSKLVSRLVEDKTADRAYVGTFLVRDSGQEHVAVTQSLNTGAENKEDGELKGETLYKRLHEYGTLCKVMSVVKNFHGMMTTVSLYGEARLHLKGMVSEDPLIVSVEWAKEKPFDPREDVLKATFLEVIVTMNELMGLNPLFRGAVNNFLLSNEPNASNVSNIAIGLSLASEGLVQQQGLEELDVLKRLNLALTILKREIDISKLQASIAKAIEEKITGEQRRFLLMEQLKAIKKELGLETDDKTALTVKFRERLDLCKEGCPPHVLQVIEDELAKLQLLEPSSSEFNVTRNYLDWLTSIPWGHYSEENFDVRGAQRILDADHYGLSDIKERILEFIAVGKLRGTAQGKIICLSGPPGVGKTSIGRSIAHALNRKFFRFSVGGLTDVAEIKGHRRTYVGAMPGKMVQCLKTTGTANPLVLIDEIDKLGRGHTGDPASALLELLDPEQNANFLDHYLDVPIDLSKVLFVCTANIVETIPGPLLDRMEVIRLVGYITDEKLHIAQDYLEPAARQACGIRPEQAGITKSALYSLIETYCREAGVRNLQKHIEKIYRKIALKLVLKDTEVQEETQVRDAAEEGSSVGYVVEECIGSELRQDMKSTETIESAVIVEEVASGESGIENKDEALPAGKNDIDKSMEEGQMLSGEGKIALNLVLKDTEVQEETQLRDAPEGVEVYSTVEEASLVGYVAEEIIGSEVQKNMESTETIEPAVILEEAASGESETENKDEAWPAGKNDTEKCLEKEQMIPGETEIVLKLGLKDTEVQEETQVKDSSDGTKVHSAAEEASLVGYVVEECIGSEAQQDMESTETIEPAVIVEEVASGESGIENKDEVLPAGKNVTERSTEEEQMLSGETEVVELPLVEQADAADNKIQKILVDESNLPEYVGNPVFQSDRIYDDTPIGVVMGLAWTAMGGSTLYVETSLVEHAEGKGALHLTGQLGDVMKESASIAHTVARAILRMKDPSNQFFANTRLHLHVPAGATPKDGPSAGCTMITSLLSVALKKGVRRDVAMTGEVTLTGRILPIGGVKEKTIAARRSGVKIVIFPGGNKRDFDELPSHVKEGIEVHFVEDYDEIFKIAFDEELSSTG